MSINEILPYLTKLILGLIILILIFRLMGHKELAQVTPLDLAFTVILADLVAGVIHTKDLTWVHLIFLCGIWALLIYLLEIIQKSSKKANDLISGEPEVLIKNGKINERLMKRLNMTQKELDAKLRQKGIFEMEDVELAIMEVNGEISVKGR